MLRMHGFTNQTQLHGSIASLNIPSQTTPLYIPTKPEYTPTNNV